MDSSNKREWRDLLAQKRAEYQEEIQEALRAVARIQGAIIAVDDLLAAGEVNIEDGALPDAPGSEVEAS